MQNSPHPHLAPTYGVMVQFVEAEAPSETLDAEKKKSGQRRMVCKFYLIPHPISRLQRFLVENFWFFQYFPLLFVSISVVHILNQQKN